MKAIKPNFKISNIRIITVLLSVLAVLLSFGVLRDSDTLITHDQANNLYSVNKIQNVVLDGEFIRLQTVTGNFNID